MIERPNLCQLQWEMYNYCVKGYKNNNLQCKKRDDIDLATLKDCLAVILFVDLGMGMGEGRAKKIRASFEALFSK